MNTKKLLLVQCLVLFGGTIFAWSKLLPQFINFYAIYGTFLRVSDCIVPNPLVTACLYGSLAFLVALFWSVLVYQRPNIVSERRLRNFLLFCVAFAGSVVLFEAAEFYKIFKATVSVTCTPGVSPVETPCFFGMLFFMCAFTAGVSATRALARGKSGIVSE